MLSSTKTIFQRTFKPLGFEELLRISLYLLSLNFQRSNVISNRFSCRLASLRLTQQLLQPSRLSSSHVQTGKYFQHPWLASTHFPVNTFQSSTQILTNRALIHHLEPRRHTIAEALLKWRLIHFVSEVSRLKS